MPDPSIAAALGRATAHAPFLRQIIAQRPEVVALIEAGDFAGALAAGRETAETPDRVARALRRERQALALTVAIGDLAGIMPFETVVATLSAFADRALDLAIRTALAERYPDAAPTGFAALALGKHGSRELNYSSDIDPILIFDPETLPRRAREEPVEAAVRIARRVVELLQSRDGDGYVLRVDLRLRPSPEASPLALPVDAALSYYESSALPWERAAFIRARAAAGDVALGRRFLDAVRPFVWRRAVDFGAVREVRAISRRIRDHAAQGQRLGPGFDLKKGRGGIREVEFFAQIHQLIHGGREPALRAPATLDALAALAAAGRIGADEATALADAYRLYRTIEHRLQMVADQQTHSLPRDPAALDNVAALHGLADGDALVDLLRPHVERVGDTYDSLDVDRPEGLSQDAALLDGALAAAGFPDPAAARARIEGWRAGRMRALRTPAAVAALEAVLPALVAALGKAPDPNVALNRFDDIVARLPSAINLFRLLEARPALARLLTHVLVHAPALSEALARRPALLDGLIDATAFDPPGSVETLAAEFAAREAGDDYQALLDRARQHVGERRFALGVQLVEQASDPIEVAQGYARVAEAAIAALGDATVAEFEAAHGRVPGGELPKSELVVLALGRLGGAALTHASDLDLVYLFTGDHLTESDGRKPLGATQYFNRLGQRLTGALSVATASGPLYEVDTRLRPSGGQGLLAVSTESFALYQRTSAWTWEHMALTRARPVFGSAAARGEVARIIEATLRRPRDRATLLADAVKMRGEIARHKPAAGDLDVKLIGGGLVDCEFTVQVLQLSTGIGVDPRMRVALAALVAAGLVTPALPEAYALLVRMLVTLRLVSPGLGEPPEASRALVAQACGQADWPALLDAYAKARATIAAEWARVAD
ncbi:bifunctional [glutamine synthetase] adenylyltransferase/[glutamine synthetase]-adenylyl-L-tyrosine phosphorylase [Sphingomonas solaris]|uniref:Bifunctional [glutamine synthetase] adenylyltransferase/[glutamine synthetase]-adenylyl-L-tyrosine phosphorylase n=1 Tax=Alterirhizorhabdus solaris TaxID=2529389 RepID=A0A558R8D2_9SPHN|nr:bifunctional [glutamine synthetase] adenylyltransferase/[glutamine synthetase]-adenylyl-L-tyrosine phosphorylase [Sphingomonas solaris]TVV75653.1 bifunctional [glutamine synthetase] adenylyltransferase/[glutamine synthetase]-adenylyl-L-tyrosine phosphorylase [Sphingomonas solaris]